MNILVTSDLHGNLPDIKEPIELLLICGDICPVHDQYYMYQLDWFKNQFASWINSLNFKDEFSQVIMTWGNHDHVGERITKDEIKAVRKKTHSRLTVLKNETCDYEYLTDNGMQTLKIFGTPYCKIFGNWAFMVSEDTLREKFAMCPNGVDILLSHDSPAMYETGVIREGWSEGVDAGNVVLDECIREKHPKINVHGHIHSSCRDFKEYDGTYIVNTSYVNERYNPVGYVLKIVLDDNNNVVSSDTVLCDVKIKY